MRAPPYPSVLRSFVGVLAVALIACVAAVPNGDRPRDNPSERSTPEFAGVLSVNNTQYPDVDVYTVRDGVTVRKLGQVTGFDSKSFALTTGDVLEGSTIQFAAHAIGSRQRFDYVSDKGNGHVGAHYEWRLGGAGPGTEFLSQRSAEYSSADTEPPNRRAVTAQLRDSLPDDTALRVRFGATNVTRTNLPATFVLARRE